MTFEATPQTDYIDVVKERKAVYPFKDMIAKGKGSGFVIPADRADLFQHCRVLTSNFNKKHGTRISCRKDQKGNLVVRLDADAPIKADDTAELLEQSINVVEAAKQDKEAPSKQQFCDWLKTLTPGTNAILKAEYAHRFTEFMLWAAEIPGCKAEVSSYNPPTLKITKKGE